MTDVCMIIDESGSMQGKRAQTVQAFNEYIEGVREDNSVVNVHVVTFNSNRIATLYDGVPIANVGQLNKESYQPRATTPLYDAIGQTLERMVGNRMFVVVVTDGFENASREHDRESIAAMIVEKEALGWDFIFLGADFDAWGNARDLGLSRGKTLSFSGAQLVEGLQGARAATTAYHTSGEKLPDDYFEGYFDPDNN